MFSDHICACSMIPDHMLRNIAVNGDPYQRSWAIKALVKSASLLMRRQFVAQIPVDTPSLFGSMLRRHVFTTNNSESLPGELVRAEGDQPNTDIVVNEAYDGAGAVYDMYKTVFGRNSIDDRGISIDSTVHYSQNYDNAFWDGRQMIYGDGDGKLFNRFTSSIDVIGHELTHGVTQYSARLVYWDQPGALNEHFSDVFGTLIKQRVLQQTVKTADWLIGSNLLAKGVKGVALRSMREPGTAYDDPILGRDPQVNNLKDYMDMQDDNGGVHVFSGIYNVLFYRVCEQLDDSWKPGLLWYKVLTTRLAPRADFQRCAQALISTAGDMFGANSDEQQAVKKAVASVGITV